MSARPDSHAYHCVSFFWNTVFQTNWLLSNHELSLHSTANFQERQFVKRNMCLITISDESNNNHNISISMNLKNDPVLDVFWIVGMQLYNRNMIFQRRSTWERSRVTSMDHEYYGRENKCRNSLLRYKRNPSVTRQGSSNLEYVLSRLNPLDYDVIQKEVFQIRVW